MGKYFLLLAYLCFGVSCQSKKTKIVAGIEIPADNTISEIRIRNYVNKVYVLLLGQTPPTPELQKQVDYLKFENVSIRGRKKFIDRIQNREIYNRVLYTQNYTALLNFIFHPNKLEETLAIWQKYEPIPENIAEINRLILMDCIPHDLRVGQLSLHQMHTRLSYNSFYDFANMGTQNFVVSMFQNFLQRYPTSYELDQGKKMVDGKQAILFRRIGSSKRDFVKIFFESTDYFEGQVRHLFKRYLLREPSSKEMVYFTIQYKNGKNFRALQKHILSMDELL